MADAPSPPPKTWNDWVADNGYGAAAVLGTLMIVAGAVLAAYERPESALVWAGAVIVAVGLVGERILEFSVGKEGASVKFSEVKERVVEAFETAKETAPTVAAEAEAPDQPVAWSIPFAIDGNVWSDRAVGTLVTALGSNSRSSFERSLGAFQEMAANGTAVVRVADEVHVDDQADASVSRGSVKLRMHRPRPPDDQ